MSILRFPGTNFRRVRQHLEASLADTPPGLSYDARIPSADPAGLHLSGADLADMAEIVDCVGVFDCDAEDHQPRYVRPTSGTDAEAQNEVER